jgi:hypothetical protein
MTPSRYLYQCVAVQYMAKDYGCRQDGKIDSFYRETL